MVHCIFKEMVPKTNCKNIDLDLLKHYTIFFVIRHLTDNSIDPRFIRSYIGFADIASDFNQLFLN